MIRNRTLMQSALGLFAAAAMSVCVHAQTVIAPDKLVHDTAEEVLQVIRTDPEILNGNSERVVQLAEEKVLPHFDFRRMTQLAVGRNWRNATPEQRDRLVPEFRTLLIRTYSSAMVQYKDQTLEYPPLAMKPDDTQVLVKTVIKQSVGQPVDMDYRMYKGDDGWKVFDVIVAGVSMVVNYRSSFEATINKSGIEGLIAELKTKNKESGPA